MTQPALLRLKDIMEEVGPGRLEEPENRGVCNTQCPVCERE